MRVRRSKTYNHKKVEEKFRRPIEDILRELYIDKELTCEKIGGILGYHFSTISKWLHRFGIMEELRNKSSSQLQLEK